MKGAFFLFGAVVLCLGVYFVWLRYARLAEPLKINQIKIGEHILEVEVADSMLARERGLSGRDALPMGKGMLFVFPIASRYGFWMRDMKIPLDIVWIKGSRVIGVTEQVYPQPNLSFWNLPIYHPPESVDKVLEVAAGSVALYGWQKDSVVVFGTSTIQ